MKRNQRKKWATNEVNFIKSVGSAFNWEWLDCRETLLNQFKNCNVERVNIFIYLIYFKFNYFRLRESFIA
jgi:hypothetical protein